MKRIAILIIAMLFTAALCAQVTVNGPIVKTLQATLTSSATQLSTSTSAVYQVIIQNNAAHTMRCGDANVTSTRGAYLVASGGSINLGPLSIQGISLNQLYCIGTSADVVDVIYLQ